MDLVLWLTAGLVAGVLATIFAGGNGHTVSGDIAVGMVGAVFGGWLFSAMGMQVPSASAPDTIGLAFVGGVVLLVSVRAIAAPRRWRFA